MALSKQQVEQFNRDGFLSPIDVLTPAEAAAIKAKLEAAETENPAEISGRNRNNSHIVYPFLDALTHHPTIISAVSSLLGDDLLVCGTVLFIKEPHSEDFVSFHQDVTYMGLEPYDGVSAWVALTPSNADNGCMRMLPGSHIDSLRPHSETDDGANLLTRGQTVTDVDESSVVDLVLEPGQMSLHHLKTLHDSKPNPSNERRIGFTIQSYITPQVRQTLGTMKVQLAKGSDEIGHHETVQRPLPNGEDVAQARLRRDQVNADWSDILYANSNHKRVY